LDYGSKNLARERVNASFVDGFCGSLKINTAMETTARMENDGTMKDIYGNRTGRIDNYRK